MNEIEAIKWQLGRYRADLARQIDRLYNALEELQRTTILLTRTDGSTPADIDRWLDSRGFDVDEDGFFQSLPLLRAYRDGLAPEDAISFSWGHHLRERPDVRWEMYRHRNLGPHLKHIHDRLGDIGWIYYQSAHNASLQYPFIDQCRAITSDFDWSTYHTFVSVCPENNPRREIRWTPPTIDYAGEGLILAVSIPVWDGETFMGLWSIDLPPRFLYGDFEFSKTTPDKAQFIVNREGMLLLHKEMHVKIDNAQGRIILHPLSELGGGWAGLEMDALLSGKDNLLEITDADGNPWQFCFQYMPDVEWILFSGILRSSMDEAAAQQLQQAFRQIADGNYAHRIESAPYNALPTLVDEFNKMSVRLDHAEKTREEMERQLRQAQKLEAVGRLAGGVAHDSNNITNVIMGYAEMALGKIKKNDPLYKFLEEIYNAARRSMALTRQLLAFARCQSIAPKVLDINQAVDGLLKMLKRMIGEDIELIWNSKEGIWPIKIDPTQVDQLLANLCVNARDAISNVGRIVIETANVEFDDRYCAVHRDFIPGKFVQLTVSDDGIGMDRETQEKIFEPFFSTKAAGRGTGLGLATVYGIVKQNNGFINVYSEPEKGTSFKIYLPRTEGQAIETIPGTPDQVPLGHGETLLLVEDEPALLSLAEEMLKELGYRVLAAGSPGEALELAGRHPNIDMLLTDVIMPQITGRELANRLLSLFPGLCVLFMSGYTANVITHRGVLDDGVSMVQKPFSKKELANKIREVLAAKKP